MERLDGAELHETCSSTSSTTPINKRINRDIKPYSWSYLKSRFSGDKGFDLHETSDFLMEMNSSPFKSLLVVFANPRSGANDGSSLSSVLARKLELHPEQLILLDSDGPAPALNKFKGINHTLLIMGGDGTIGWIMGEMDKIDYEDKAPPVIVLPMGTGNDLARFLNFGPGVSTFPEIKKSLQSIDFDNPNDSLVDLDRWKMTIKSLPMVASSEDVPSEQESVFNNYFSLGADAKVALKFHNAREKRKTSCCQFQFMNKIAYAKHSATSLYNNVSLTDVLTLTVDGKEITFPYDIQALVFLNIGSYAAGTNPWKRSSSNTKFEKQSISDALVEVLGFRTLFHAGICQVGLPGATRIAQGSEISIRLTQGLPAQVDGEPYMQGPCELKIDHFTQTRVYRKTINDGCCV